MKFRTLKEDEIECRVGQISAKGFTLLLYKNARVDMDLLDETVGAGNWQRDHKAMDNQMGLRNGKQHGKGKRRSIGQFQKSVRECGHRQGIVHIAVRMDSGECIEA